MFGTERFEVKLVFVDRFGYPAFDIDFAAASCVLVTYEGVIGKTGENRLHIVCIARIDVALNNGYQRNWHRVKKMFGYHGFGANPSSDAKPSLRLRLDETT